MNRQAARFGVGLGGFAAVWLYVGDPAMGADHGDGPLLADLSNSQLNINDLYIFRSPANGENVVFTVTDHPFPGVMSPDTFGSRARFERRADAGADTFPRTVDSARNFFGPNVNTQAATIQIRPDD